MLHVVKATAIGTGMRFFKYILIFISKIANKWKFYPDLKWKNEIVTYFIWSVIFLQLLQLALLVEENFWKMKEENPTITS